MSANDKLYEPLTLEQVLMTAGYCSPDNRIIQQLADTMRENAYLKDTIEELMAEQRNKESGGYTVPSTQGVLVQKPGSAASGMTEYVAVPTKDTSDSVAERTMQELHVAMEPVDGSTKYSYAVGDMGEGPAVKAASRGTPTKPTGK